MISHKQQGSTLTTVLAVVVLGTVLGVLLLLLFGNRNPGTDTVSTLVPGAAGTTLVQKDKAASAPADTSATSSPDTDQATPMTTNSAPMATGAASNTPVEGQAASGSPGQQQDTSAAAEKTLEQTVSDTAFRGTGQEIYVQACQSCHMPGGKGAVGAGVYPPLAGNPKLKIAQYPINMVLFGNGGMPSFGHYMSDEQISEVVNYVRTELNNNTDKVTPADIKKARPADPHYMVFGEAAG